MALTIAGSDPSGGAGLQADLKTFAAWGVYGAAVVTGLTAQNTKEVRGAFGVPADFVAAQIAAVLDDLHVGAAKTGMLPTAAIVVAVADALGRAAALPLVVDPVLVSTTGHALTDDSTVAAVRHVLLPRATIVTPNLPEAGALLGTTVRTRADMRDAARELVARGARAALVKGGHLDEGAATDVFCTGIDCIELEAPRIVGVSTHGTGCTLAAAIAAGLARGHTLPVAVERAKAYVTRALDASLAIGRGLRVLDHAVDTGDAG